MDILNLSLKELAASIQTKKISALEVVKFYRARIEKLDSQLNSITRLNHQAEQDAQALDEKIAKGEKIGSLAGVPFGIKEMLCTKGLTTTAGSKILENFIPPYDSTVVSKLRLAGAIVLAKTNQDEFAMGSSSETSFHGAVKNPWNLACTPGGSSGGSAAAQAAKLVAASIGTDTGGSIRQPASFCGVVGIKPTYGRVSRYGIIAYASSLDQAGPMVNSVEDAALVLENICGFDPKDGTSSQQKVPAFSQVLTENIKGMKIGIMKEYQVNGVDTEVQKVIDQCTQILKQKGAEVVEVSVPLSEYAIPIYYLIAASEASSNLARYDGVKYGYRAHFENLSVDLDYFYSKTRGEAFGNEVKRRIMLGTYCLSSGYYNAYYNKAGQVRRLLRDQYLKAFSQCDVILSPVTTHPAFKIGERINDPLAMYLNDIFTTSTNLAGLPGLSVPAGFSQNNLPIGVQLTARHFAEQSILNVAYAIEKAVDLKGKKPHVI